MSWFDVLEPGLLVQFVAIIIEGGKGSGGGGGGGILIAFHAK